MFIHWFCSPYCVCGGGGCVGSLSCGVALGALSSFTIILLRKRELVAVQLLCCACFLFCVSSSRCHGWSAVCECGVFWSYPFTFHMISFHDKRTVVHLNICSRRISKLHFLDKNISRIRVKFKPVVCSSRD